MRGRCRALVAFGDRPGGDRQAREVIEVEVISNRPEERRDREGQEARPDPVGQDTQLAPIRPIRRQARGAARATNARDEQEDEEDQAE